MFMGCMWVCWGGKFTRCIFWRIQWLTSQMDLGCGSAQFLGVFIDDGNGLVKHRGGRENTIGHRMSS